MRQQTVTSISKKLKLAQVDWDMATGEDGQFSSGLCPKNRYAFSVQVKVLEGAAASKASVPADKKNRHRPRGLSIQAMVLTGQNWRITVKDKVL